MDILNKNEGSRETSDHGIFSIVNDNLYAGRLNKSARGPRFYEYDSNSPFGHSGLDKRENAKKMLIACVSGVSRLASVGLDQESPGISKLGTVVFRQTLTEIADGRFLPKSISDTPSFSKGVHEIRIGAESFSGDKYLQDRIRQIVRTAQNGGEENLNQTGINGPVYIFNMDGEVGVANNLLDLESVRALLQWGTYWEPVAGIGDAQDRKIANGYPGVIARLYYRKSEVNIGPFVLISLRASGLDANVGGGVRDSVSRILSSEELPFLPKEYQSLLVGELIPSLMKVTDMGLGQIGYRYIHDPAKAEETVSYNLDLYKKSFMGDALEGTSVCFTQTAGGPLRLPKYQTSHKDIYEKVRAFNEKYGTRFGNVDLIDGVIYK